MSNGYNGYSQSGYGYGYGGNVYGNVTIREREKALEREKNEWNVYWMKKEEQCQLEQKRKEEDWRLEKKKYEEQKWKWTGELWQKAAQLNVKESEIAKREKELAKHEADLDEETAKVLEQYKRAKKLERQSKRREERIQQAKQQIQQQANEHFSIVYQTLQLGIKSLHHQSSSILAPTSMSGSSDSLPPSTRQSISPVQSPLSSDNSIPLPFEYHLFILRSRPATLLHFLYLAK